MKKLLQSKLAKIAGVIALVLALMVGASSISVAQSEGGGVQISLSFNQVMEVLGILLPQDEGSFGAQSGPDHYNLQVFYAGQVDGGLAVSTTTLGNTPGDVTDLIRQGGYVRYLTINADEATTYTFPASSTLSHYIPQSGMCANVLLENSGDSNLTLAAGTGIDMQEPDGQNVVIGTTNFANLLLCRQANTDIVIIVDETIPG